MITVLSNLFNRAFAFISDKLSEGSRKDSLTRPPVRNTSWGDYLHSDPGDPPLLGREPKCKESKKSFRATVAMSEDFPLTVNMLLSVLEVSLIDICSWLRNLHKTLCNNLLPDYSASIQALSKAEGLCRDEAASGFPRQSRHSRSGH